MQLPCFDTVFCRMQNVDLCFKWYEDTIVFLVFFFIFLFRPNGKSVQLDEKDFPQCYGNIFERAILKVT